MRCNCKCDVKSWLINGFVIAVLYLGLDTFFHDYCLKTVYIENAQFFRPMEAMTALKWLGYPAYLLFGLLFVCIYAKGHEEGKSKAGQGLRYGILMGVFYWGTHLLGGYPYMPWPNKLYLDWFAVGLFEFAVLGFILGMIYKPATSTS